MNVSSVKNLNGETFSAVQDVSLTDVVQTNSGNWDNVTNKLDTTSFSDVSGNFLTAVDLTPYQTIEGMTAYQPVGDYATTSEVNTVSSLLSGAIDYVSANAGDEFPVSADEAVQYVQTNSGTIDDTVTSYQTNSGTFLTAHQTISAEEWNSNYETVNTNSGAWGGSALPISAGPGVKISLQNDTLVFENDETVLWETTANQSIVTASESTYNFDMTRFYMKDDNNDYAIIDLPSYLSANHGGNFMPFDNVGDIMRFATVKTTDGTVWSADGKQKINSTAFSDIGNGWIYIQKIVGINRK